MSKTTIKNGNRVVNRLTRLNFDRKLLYQRMQSIDKSILETTLSLVEKNLIKKNLIAKTYDGLSRLNGQKAKLELKMLKIDVGISEIAKSALVKEI